jgi:hypothetical protein
MSGVTLPHDDNISQFHCQWRLIVQQLWNDDAAAMSVDDVLHSLRKNMQRLACSRFDKSTRRVSKGLANCLCERMQLGFPGLAPSFCL